MAVARAAQRVIISTTAYATILRIATTVMDIIFPVVVHQTVIVLHVA
jgi:hypothetical protein